MVIRRVFLFLMVCLLAFNLACKQERADLVLWTSLKDEMPAIQKIADEFTKETGIKVKIDFVPFTELQPKFQVAAPVGQGADLITGPHDWIGPMTTADIIQSVTIEDSQLKEFIPASLGSMSYQGKLYGLPISIEAAVLIYNKDLVPNPPTTMEELIPLAQKLTTKDQYGFLFDINNFYFSWPFFAGYDTEIFLKTPDNNLDPYRLGLTSPQALEAAEFILSLQNKHQLIPKGISLDIANGLFAGKKLAMIINGPWALNNYKGKINYGVTQLPKLANGKYPRPFVGVFGILMNKKTVNRDKALKFMQYVTRKESLVLIYLSNGRIPARSDSQQDPRVAQNPDVKEVSKAALNGTPMPTLPAMTQIWDPMGKALKLMTSGTQTPKQALEEAQTTIVKNIKRMME